MKRVRGVKRESSMATQRRLQLVRQLMRGPATTAELVNALRERMGEHIYPDSAPEALRHDLVVVREIFACEIVYQPDQGYVLVSLGHLAILDLPPDEREQLATLLSTLRRRDTEVAERLLAHLRMLLPEA